MIFLDCDIKLNDEDIVAVENDLGMKFPDALRYLFLNHNGRWGRSLTRPLVDEQSSVSSMGYSVTPWSVRNEQPRVD